MSKKLFRSKDNKMISGVCAGFAYYLELDPTIVRILWALVTLFVFPVGLVGYFLCAIIMPEGATYNADYSSNHQGSSSNYNKEKGLSDHNKLVLGIVLVAIGALLLAKRFVFWFDLGHLWPLLLILGGAYIIFKGKE